MAFRQALAQGDASPHAHAVAVRFVLLVPLAGIAHRGPYMWIGRAFDVTFTSMAAQGFVRSDMRWVAVHYDDPFAVPEAPLQSRAGLSQPLNAAAPQPPLESFTLGGTWCAVLRRQGPYAKMRSANQWLYGHWLVQSGDEAADSPVFEDYLNNTYDMA